MAEELAVPPHVDLPAMSEGEADQQLARDGFQISALVAKADHRFRAEDHRGAAAFYAFAMKCSSARGVPDCAAAKDSERASAMAAWLAQRFRNHILSSLDQVYPASGWPERFRTAVQILLGDAQRDLVTELFPQMPQLFFYPGLPHIEFVDPAGFEWREAVEQRFGAMREEAVQLLASTGDFQPYVTKTADRPQGDVHGLLENSDWSSLYLWTDGAPVEAAVSRCPTIFNTIMDNVPLCHIGRRAPAVLLSLLKPGAHIPPHSDAEHPLHLPRAVDRPAGLPFSCRRAGHRMAGGASPRF